MNDIVNEPIGNKDWLDIFAAGILVNRWGEVGMNAFRLGMRVAAAAEAEGLEEHPWQINGLAPVAAANGTGPGSARAITAMPPTCDGGELASVLPLRPAGRRGRHRKTASI